jgi:hypothetical protein
MPSFSLSSDEGIVDGYHNRAYDDEDASGGRNLAFAAIQVLGS